MSSIKLTADSGGGTVELKAPATTTSNAAVVFKLPVADGTSGQALTTNASGQLAFSSVAAGGASNIAFNSGNGIDFSAAAGGGASSSILDEYEEGTFTPTARGNNTNSSPVISGSGKYTRVGRLVQCTIHFSAENGSYLPSGEYFQIHGLPFITDGTHIMPGPGMNYKVVFNEEYQLHSDV